MSSTCPPSTRATTSRHGALLPPPPPSRLRRGAHAPPCACAQAPGVQHPVLAAAACWQRAHSRHVLHVPTCMQSCRRPRARARRRWRSGARRRTSARCCTLTMRPSTARSCGSSSSTFSCRPRCRRALRRPLSRVVPTVHAAAGRGVLGSSFVCACAGDALCSKCLTKMARAWFRRCLPRTRVRMGFIAARPTTEQLSISPPPCAHVRAAAVRKLPG